MHDTWGLTDHCCRACFGRILQRDATFRCADCGTEASGAPNAICGCGLLPGPLAVRTGHAGATFRCGQNPRRGPDSLAEVVILFGEVPAPVV